VYWSSCKHARAIVNHLGQEVKRGRTVVPKYDTRDVCPAIGGLPIDVTIGVTLLKPLVVVLMENNIVGDLKLKHDLGTVRIAHYITSHPIGLFVIDVGSAGTAVTYTPARSKDAVFLLDALEAIKVGDVKHTN
tara:strand:- start:975 stop:1373 length:399 start_codon:yes stop_codon:yes gene_type:complete